MSIETAKQMLKDNTNNFNSFYAYNKNGNNKICFRTYFDINNIINGNINLANTEIYSNSVLYIYNKREYDVNLEIINKDSYIITDNILIDNFNKKKIITEKSELIIDSHYYQEEIIPFNTTKNNIKINSKFPNKFLSFIIQPGGLITGSKYLHIPGENFFKNAAKRFCYKYSKSYYGTFVNNIFDDNVFDPDSAVDSDNLNNEIFYHDFFDILNIYSIKIGEKLSFNDVKPNNVNYQIFFDLFNKLSPKLINSAVIIKNDDSGITNIPIFNKNNISVNINSLNKQDKFLLSLETSELNSLYPSTSDLYNEGHSNYDYNIYDYSTFTTQLDRKEDSILEYISLELNNIPKMDLFNVKFLQTLNNISIIWQLKIKYIFIVFHYYQNNIIHQVLVIFLFLINLMFYII